MKKAMFLDYKPMRYEGKGFLRNLNIRTHRDITGEMWFGGGVGVFPLNYLLISSNSSFAFSESSFFNISYCSKAESLSLIST